MKIIPSANHYWLTNARIPISLLDADSLDGTTQPTWEDLVLVDLEILDGVVVRVKATSSEAVSEQPSIDLRQGQVWPCFVDIHTHLDKGHTWNRTPNPDGTFASALTAVQADAEEHWQAEGVYRRMEFGLRCSYAHGTKAVRTHIDAAGQPAEFSFEAFQTLRREWADRLVLQAVSLVSLDYFLTPAGEALADRMAEIGGVLGGVTWMNPDLSTQLDRVFWLAQERGLDLDFHTDESVNPEDETLRYIAEAVIRNSFQGQVTCGHACSLSVQPPEVAAATMSLVKQAGIGIVSLPMCNLYLQDRQSNRTPRWRGVTLLHELKQYGIPVAIASDNCRDPFHGFGDHDVMEVFSLSARIAHLDMPYGYWPRAATTTPADLMGLPAVGRIGVGLPADLVLFKARNFSELLSRPQYDRIVLRAGKPIDTTLPDYAELDNWVGA